MSILIAIAAIGIILWTLPLLLELLGIVISAGVWLIGAAIAVAAVVGVVLFLGSNPELLGLAIAVIVAISLLSFFFRGLDNFNERRRLKNVTPENRSNNVIEHIPEEGSLSIDADATDIMIYQSALNVGPHKSVQEVMSEIYNFGLSDGNFDVGTYLKLNNASRKILEKAKLDETAILADEVEFNAIKARADAANKRMLFINSQIDELKSMQTWLNQNLEEWIIEQSKAGKSLPFSLMWRTIGYKGVADKWNHGNLIIALDELGLLEKLKSTRTNDRWDKQTRNAYIIRSLFFCGEEIEQLLTRMRDNGIDLEINWSDTLVIKKK